MGISMDRLACTKRGLWMKIASKSYQPELFEEATYRAWEQSGAFAPSGDSKSFAIMLPPPNVTGVLHMGHALTLTLEDVLVRWHRMCGEKTLWLPGTDHAGIATQIQVEKALAKEKKSRHDLGREAFIERTWQWKEEHGKAICAQLRRLGASLDWSRERFTMDESMQLAVRETFVRLYEDGLLYRGERMIHWCTRCQTALSDLEVVSESVTGSLWHLKYDDLIVATTRPETVFGDIAVAIHPDDPRAQDLVGKSVTVPGSGHKVPIIADTSVDPLFGSGLLKVTPAHDFTDYEIGTRHQLKAVSVINAKGLMTVGPYTGMRALDARKQFIQDFAGSIERTEERIQNIGCCQRCQTVLEPRISLQWFIKMESLAQPAIAAVRSGAVRISPSNWDKTYFDWLESIQDWCISRQLWWGHRIPAWMCQDCHQITVARVDPSRCSHCQGGAIQQDSDVLDTWFSSALWPFATLGWPEKTSDFDAFYPNAVLETGFDILFFWVARMMMMGMYLTGKAPFTDIYLHAMVRDEKGEKMSKSKGNVIDPLDVIDQFGTDPLRFTLAMMAGQGRDIKLSLSRVEGYRAFCNKLWNAVQFFLLQDRLEAMPEEIRLPENRWILGSLARLTEQVTQAYGDFALQDAAQALYTFGWHELCDWWIEIAKLRFKQDGQESYATMRYVLDQYMRLLHPIMPFLTEHLWGVLEPREGFLMHASFPVGRHYAYPEKGFEQTKLVVDAIRTFRGEHKILPKVEILMEPVPGHKELIEHLGRVRFVDATKDPRSMHVAGLELRFEYQADKEAERLRLTKALEKAQADLQFVERKLQDEAFCAKAPPALVAKEIARANDLRRVVQGIVEELE